MSERFEVHITKPKDIQYTAIIWVVTQHFSSIIDCELYISRSPHRLRRRLYNRGLTLRGAGVGTYMYYQNVNSRIWPVSTPAKMLLISCAHSSDWRLWVDINSLAGRDSAASSSWETNAGKMLLYKICTTNTKPLLHKVEQKIAIYQWQGINDYLPMLKAECETMTNHDI